MRAWHRIIFLMVSFALFLGVSSCSSKNGSSNNFLYVKAIYSMPVSYDPIKMNDGASLAFSELVYEGLARYSEDFNAIPALAESWTTSSDGLVMTFKLNPKAKFHDGSKVTALDVKVSLSRAVSPESVVFKYYDVIKGAKEYHSNKANEVEGLKVVDEQTIEIDLVKPFPPMIYILAGATAKVFPANKLKDSSFFHSPVGSGPFKISTIEKDRILLERFDGYYGIKPELKKMSLELNDQTVAMKKAKEGLVHDLSLWPMNGKEEVFKTGQDVQGIMADTWIVGMNTRFAPFNDLKVRKLFKKSIDADKFRKTFYPDAKTAWGYIPNGYTGHISEKVETQKTNGKIPQNLITIAIPEELDQSETIKKFFEDELRTKSWNVKVEKMKWAEMMAKYEKKELQAFFFAMNVDYPDSEFLLSNFESTNPDNFSGIKDKTIDSLVEKSRSIQDRIARQKVQEELAKRINDLSLTANLIHSRSHYWLNRCVEGFKPNLLAVAYTDYRTVRFNEECMRGERR